MRNINDPYLVLFSYNITSKTSPTFTFAIVNFKTGSKTAPDFSEFYAFSSTEIKATAQWGFGSIPMKITAQYGLVTDHNYNSYVLAGSYLTFLQAWTAIQIPTTSSVSTTYAMFNTTPSHSLYSLMSSNSYVPSGTTNLVFQLFIPNTTLSTINNNAESSSTPTLVTLKTEPSGFPPLPGFGINSPDSCTIYITCVLNVQKCKRHKNIN